jgi:regulator of sigma E protease
MDVISHNVLPFFVIIVVLIVVHELGHFITGKLAGVKVLEFGLGYPPRLWGIKRGETEYTINALPLGGFVRLLGEEDPTDPRSLAAKPRWVRLVVLGSGAVMNVFLAIFLFAMALMIPRGVDVSRTRVSEVVPNSPAAAAGILPGDVIFAIDGHNVQNTSDLSYQIRLHLGQTITMKVRRQQGASGAQFLDIPVHARWSAPNYVDAQGVTHGQGPTGITIGPAYGSVQVIPPDERAKLAKSLPPGETVPTTRLLPFSQTQWEPPWQAFPDGARKSYESLILARNEIFSRIRGGLGGDKGFQVTGPVGIAQLTGEVVKEAGWKSLVDLAALLSMNLAVLNILPLPMLDGGRVVFVLLEYVRRGRRVKPEKEAMVHLVGLVAILTLAAVITYFDIARLFAGNGIIR